MCLRVTTQKQPKKQIDVTTNVCGQIASGNRFIRGIMLESHLNEGDQKISENLNYGQSVTDACMGWEDSVSCLAKYSEAVSERRNQEN